MVCDFQCLTTYGCPTAPGQPITVNQITPGVIYSPYVEVGFKSTGGSNITVGNNSSPNGNTQNGQASIKSLEYGVSNGFGVTIEIIDEEGSNLNQFVNRLNKTVTRANSDYTMDIDFGWIITDCNNNTTSIKVSNYGNKLRFLLLNIDLSFESGKVKYKITGNDLGRRIEDTRVSNAQGTEDNKISLKEAISNLMRQNVPSVNQVLYWDQDGIDWGFAGDAGPDGPMACWTSDQQNALATIRRWIAPLTTHNGKGILFQWLPDVTEPTLVLLEDPTPTNGQVQPCTNNIGTYIVGGGSCSSVISFTPSLHWILTNNAGSGGINGGGATGGNRENAWSALNSTIERVGRAWTGAVDQNDVQWMIPDRIPLQRQLAFIAHENASRLQEVSLPIDAELKIMGDPFFVFPLSNTANHGVLYKYISIIVINPFYINSCNWLAQPSCNNYLSNKNWQIIGANHQINQGSYVTTLKLRLFAPNVELPQGSPLGGMAGGITFINDSGEGNPLDNGGADNIQEESQ